MNKYNYVIIKHNDPTFERESTLLDNKYSKSKKYAMMEKGIHNDGSESLNRIIYSNDLEDLQKMANSYISWYNYPMRLYKEMQQNILPLA
jgi:hypothetical protein